MNTIPFIDYDLAVAEKKYEIAMEAIADKMNSSVTDRVVEARAREESNNSIDIRMVQTPEGMSVHLFFKDSMNAFYYASGIEIVANLTPSPSSIYIYNEYSSMSVTNAREYMDNILGLSFIKEMVVYVNKLKTLQNTTMFLSNTISIFDLYAALFCTNVNIGMFSKVLVNIPNTHFKSDTTEAKSIYHAMDIIINKLTDFNILTDEEVSQCKEEPTTIIEIPVTEMRNRFKNINK